MPPSPKTAHPLATNSGWVPPFDACQKWMLCGDCPVQPFRTCRFVRDRLLRFLAVFLTGDRGFESISLHRRVYCKPDFLDQGISTMSGSPQSMARSKAGRAVATALPGPDTFS